MIKLKLKSKSNFLLFLLKRVDPVLYILLIFIGISFLFQNYISKDSIYHLKDGEYFIQFEISEELNGKFISNSLIVDNKKYTDSILVSNNLKLGDKVKCKGRLAKPMSFNEFNYREYLYNKNIYKTFQCLENISVESNRSVFSQIKEKLVSEIDKSLPYEEANIFRGIVLGDTTSFTSELKKLFVNTGTSHVSALSGFNITLITLSVYFIFSFIPSKILKFALANSVVITFLLIVGFSDSVTRAYIQSLFACIYLLSSRGRNLIRIISLMIITMILIDIKVIFSISFQLSFLATMSLIFFDKYYLNIKDLEFFNIGKQTFVTNLFTLPISINLFGKISVLTILVNVIILPIVEIITILGFFNSILILIKPDIGIFILKLTSFLPRFIYNVINFFGNMSFATFEPEYKFTLIGILVYYMFFLFIIIKKWVIKMHNIYVQIR